MEPSGIPKKDFPATLSVVYGVLLLIVGVFLGIGIESSIPLWKPRLDKPVGQVTAAFHTVGPTPPPAEQTAKTPLPQQTAASAAQLDVDQIIPGYSTADFQKPFGFELGAPGREEMLARARAEPRIAQFLQTTGKSSVQMPRAHCWQDPDQADGAAEVLCIPKFFIGGFAKCGTTDIFFQLMIHPLAVRPAQKEIYSFRNRMVPSKYAEIYKKMAEVVNRAEPGYRDRFTIDGSPSTLFDWSSDQPTPFIMQQYAPDAKILVLVREPVVRMWSEYCYFEKEAATPAGFHTQLLLALNSVGRCMREQNVSNPCMCLTEFHKKYFSKGVSRLMVGAYSCQLRAWRAVFPLAKLKLVALEEMKSNLNRTMEGVIDFLELPREEPLESSPWWPAMARVSQSGHMNSAPKTCTNVTMLPESETLLRKFYEPLSADFEAQFGVDFGSYN